LFPIFLATLTKKILKISRTSSCFVIKTSFSDKTVSFWFSAYDHFSKCFNEVADKHAPFKERKILPKQVPYMNSELKWAIYRKKMLYNKFQKHNNSKNYITFICQEKLNCWPEILGFRAPSTPFYKICLYRFTFKFSDIVSLGFGIIVLLMWLKILETIK
jgi:hypothetical protein